MSFNNFSFKRITSSGNFIPEIDGLRFIAITSVVLFHLSLFLAKLDRSHYTDNFDCSLLKQLLSHGHLGVPLFFTISGFILGTPFAKFHFGVGERISLKKYFLRRLTRLEPPYILVMTVLFFGAVYVAEVLSFKEGISSYVASIIYSHNIIFGCGPKLNGPAWSLEVEIQFYILAPFMAYLFSVKMASLRRLIFCLIILFFLILNQCIVLPSVSIINFMQYFLVGFLLSDLYISNFLILPKTKFDHLIALTFFVFIWIFDYRDFNSGFQKFLWQLSLIVSIFFLYYYVLFHKVFKLLSNRLVTNLGGMCYSIYLLHMPIILMLGKPLMKYSFSNYSLLNISLYSILLLIPIIIISSVFFLLVERPCMDKNWYNNLLKRSRQTFA